jgi:hypothetical protein
MSERLIVIIDMDLSFRGVFQCLLIAMVQFFSSLLVSLRVLLVFVGSRFVSTLWRLVSNDWVGGPSVAISFAVMSSTRLCRDLLSFFSLVILHGLIFGWLK